MGPRNLQIQRILSDRTGSWCFAERSRMIAGFDSCCPTNSHAAICHDPTVRILNCSHYSLRHTQNCALRTTGHIASANNTIQRNTRNYPKQLAISQGHDTSSRSHCSKKTKSCVRPCSCASYASCARHCYGSQHTDHRAQQPIRRTRIHGPSHCHVSCASCASCLW